MEWLNNLIKLFFGKRLRKAQKEDINLEVEKNAADKEKIELEERKADSKILKVIGRLTKREERIKARQRRRELRKDGRRKTK